MTAYRLAAAGYWLALGVWIGALVTIAVTAAVTFRTVHSFQPTLTTAQYQNLPDDAPAGQPYPLPVRVLAGAIVGNILRALAVLQFICAAAVALAVFLQCTAFKRLLPGAKITGWANLTRLALLVAAIVILLLDVLVVTPSVWQARDQMYDRTAAPAQRLAAWHRFDHLHKRNERMVGAELILLIAALAVSAFALHTPITQGNTIKNP